MPRTAVAAPLWALRQGCRTRSAPGSDECGVFVEAGKAVDAAAACSKMAPQVGQVGACGNFYEIIGDHTSDATTKHVGHTVRRSEDMLSGHVGNGLDYGKGAPGLHAEGVPRLVRGRCDEKCGLVLFGSLFFDALLAVSGLSPSHAGSQ